MHSTFSMPRTALAVGIAMVLSAPVLAADCKPSKWVRDDQVSNANYITQQSVMQAVKLVKKGETHSLGITVYPGMPAFPPRTTAMQIVGPGQQTGRSMARDFGWDITYLENLVQLWFSTGPQIDCLGHLGASGVYYNCN